MLSSRPEGRQQNREREGESELSGSESEVDIVVGEEDSVRRLRRVVREMNIATPLRVEVDQTGYIKSLDSGMYLVDSLGNGFELS